MRSLLTTNIALAEALGEQEVVNLLTATLEEDKQTDLKLTEVTQQAIMPAAGRRGGGRVLHSQEASQGKGRLELGTT